MIKYRVQKIYTRDTVDTSFYFEMLLPPSVFKEKISQQCWYHGKDFKISEDKLTVISNTYWNNEISFKQYEEWVLSCATAKEYVESQKIYEQEHNIKVSETRVLLDISTK